MSHKATNWLADLPPDLISGSEFRVLFHLCDCHNPSDGCFPSQAYLKARANVSNGTVNNVLNALETKGLIVRHRTRDGRTKRQNPTHYILGFELEKAEKPTPKSGDGADSNLDPDPTPISGPTRLQPTGEEPVSNQKITSACARGKVSTNPMVHADAERTVASFRSGRGTALDGLQPWVLDHILGAKLLTDDELKVLGLTDDGRKAS